VPDGIIHRGVSAAIFLLGGFFANEVCGETPAVLHGTLVAPRGITVKHLRARVRPAGLNEVTADCAVSGKAWTCELPAAKVDVELYSPGLAPVYLWDLDTAHTSDVDAGSVTFIAGGVLSGKIVEHGYGIKGIDVELTPAAALTGDSALRSRLKSRRAVTDRAGNYVFVDIAPGAYTLVASKDGYSTITRPQLHIETGHEQKLPRLQIAAQAKLAVYANPPADFYGNPWQARLNRGVPNTPYEQLARTGRFSLAGAWTATFLDSGKYRLEILTSKGERVDSREIDADGAATIDVHIESVPIQGKLRLGGEGTKGVVSLIWEDGSTLSFRTSAEGQFDGIVTHEGSWRATVRTATPRMELHVPEVEVRRHGDEQTANVRIDLPAGTIRGTAVDEDEQSLRASVMLLQNGTLKAVTATAEDGTFSFAGIENGASQLNATAKGFSSGYTPIVVDDDHVSPIKLVLHSLQTIRGHLLDSTGNAILGAIIRYGSAGQFGGQTATGLSGDFAIPVPKHGGVAEIAIIAPGFPRKFMTLHAPQPDAESSDVRITLGGVSGRLDVEISKSDLPWPSITSSGILRLPLFDLFLPRPGGPPAELRAGGFTFEVEPGTYTLCGNGSLQCVTKTVAAAGSATFTNNSGQQWQ
jgi:hypothetical protein